MAFSTAANSQITDAVTQLNVKVIRETPAMAVGMLYQTMSHSNSIFLESAVSSQQRANILTLASANEGTMQIYSLDTTASAGASEKVTQTGVAGILPNFLTVSRSYAA